MSERLQELLEQKEELAIQELKENIEYTRDQRGVDKNVADQEMLRRAIEVCTNSLVKGVSGCDNELQGVIRVAAQKLEVAIEKM